MKHLQRMFLSVSIAALLAACGGGGGSSSSASQDVTNNGSTDVETDVDNGQDNTDVETEVDNGDDNTSTDVDNNGDLGNIFNGPPSDYFDLNCWTLSVPVDEDNNGIADNQSDSDVADGYTHLNYFYMSDDGGMVFRTPPQGPKTSANTKYTRTELREMMRCGDTSISTKGVNKNNWVFSSAPQADQDAAGGVDGKMTATLAVNQVTTTGEDYQVGRLVIGQIHANDDEPVRLYYRKLPDNDKGSIYFAHEPRDGYGEEYTVNLIGSSSSSASDPDNGIALNQTFSYTIEVQGNDLTVSIAAPNQAVVSKTINMNGSGYDQGGQYMYFKAGVYHLNNSADSDEYAQATFYQLDVSH
ncbi:MAG: polysaccharide lyase family 7 protein [Vibrio sp.]